MHAPILQPTRSQRESFLRAAASTLSTEAAVAAYPPIADQPPATHPGRLARLPSFPLSRGAGAFA
jgi:hypothetical protein